MTVKIEPIGKADRILALFGKRRAVCLPDVTSPYGYYMAPRENFIRALLRPATRQPPKGWFYIEDLPEREINDCQ